MLAGHLHRALTGDLAGRPVLVAPSTYTQARLRFGAGELELTGEPPGYTVHTFHNGTVTSYTQSVV